MGISVLVCQSVNARESLVRQRQIEVLEQPVKVVELNSLRRFQVLRDVRVDRRNEPLLCYVFFISEVLFVSTIKKPFLKPRNGMVILELLTFFSLAIVLSNSKLCLRLLNHLAYFIEFFFRCLSAARRMHVILKKAFVAKTLILRQDKSFIRIIYNLLFSALFRRTRGRRVRSRTRRRQRRSFTHGVVQLHRQILLSE